MAASRRRSSAVTVGAIAVVSIGLSGCSSSPDYAGVCVDKSSNKRVADRDCDDSHVSGGSHGWYYVRAGSKAPAVGSAVSGGSFSEPSGTFAKGGVSSKGGTIARGGFGGGDGSFGG